MSKLPRASDLSKKEVKSLEDYLTDRISGASGSGYSSTKAWIDGTDETNALGLLRTGGYTVEFGETEPDRRRVQLVISW